MKSDFKFLCFILSILFCTNISCAGLVKKFVSWASSGQSDSVELHSLSCHWIGRLAIRMTTTFWLRVQVIKFVLLIILFLLAWFLYYYSYHSSFPLTALLLYQPLQDDPRLIQLVRQKYVIPPNYETTYDLNLMRGWWVKADADQSEGQVNAVKKLFNNARTGFFIECGANDGVLLSNTLWFEVALGWNGLLIEADPITFLKLKGTNRKAWMANVCLSPNRYAENVPFFTNPNNTLVDGLRENAEWDVNQKVFVDCIPLYTILAAINVTVVDVFSLDIEGFELQVLKTIPFEKILFKVFIIEYLHGVAPEVLQTFMNVNGFKLYRKINESLSKDSIYVHPSLLHSDFVEERY